MNDKCVRHQNFKKFFLISSLYRLPRDMFSDPVQKMFFRVQRGMLPGCIIWKDGRIRRIEIQNDTVRGGEGEDTARK